MKNIKFFPTSELMYSVVIVCLMAFSLNRSALSPDVIVGAEAFSTTSTPAKNVHDNSDAIHPTTNGDYLVINRGNTNYNGYSLRINKGGVLMASETSQFTGSRWELVSLGGDIFQFINRGDSDYNGYALRLNIDGSLMASSDTHFTGCKWELESLGNDHFRIINRGNSNFNGYALCVRDGILTVSKDIYYTGCKWELMSQ